MSFGSPEIVGLEQCRSRETNVDGWDIYPVRVYSTAQREEMHG